MRFKRMEKRDGIHFMLRRTRRVTLKYKHHNHFSHLTNLGSWRNPSLFWMQRTARRFRRRDQNHCKAHSKVILIQFNFILSYFIQSFMNNIFSLIYCLEPVLQLRKYIFSLVMWQDKPSSIMFFLVSTNSLIELTKSSSCTCGWYGMIIYYQLLVQCSYCIW